MIAVGNSDIRDPLDLLKDLTRPEHPGGRPAVFLDRDGTIIEHVHFLNDHRKVKLLPGAAEALRRLRDAGFALVVVTNQSGVGRGIVTLEQLAAIHDEMNRVLALEKTEVDAVYFCPEAPKTDDPRTIEHPDRKPAPGLLYRAATEHGLDLGASWMIGDVITDVLTGLYAQCRGSILVRTGKPFEDGDLDDCDDFHVLDNLQAAAELILADRDRNLSRPT